MTPVRKTEVLTAPEVVVAAVIAEALGILPPGRRSTSRRMRHWEEQRSGGIHVPGRQQEERFIEPSKGSFKSATWNSKSLRTFGFCKVESVTF